MLLFDYLMPADNWRISERAPTATCWIVSDCWVCPKGRRLLSLKMRELECATFLVLLRKMWQALPRLLIFMRCTPKSRVEKNMI